MNMNLVTFLILGIACFRLTHLIVKDDITAFLRAPFVEEVNELDHEGRLVKLQYPKVDSKFKAFIGALITCPWCMGIWVAIFLVLGWYLFPNIIYPLSLVLAIAGVGIVFEIATHYWSAHTFRPTQKQVQRLIEIRRAMLPTHKKTDEA